LNAVHDGSVFALLPGPIVTRYRFQARGSRIQNVFAEVDSAILGRKLPVPGGSRGPIGVACAVKGGVRAWVWRVAGGQTAGGFLRQVAAPPAELFPVPGRSAGRDDRTPDSTRKRSCWSAAGCSQPGASRCP